MKKNVIHVKYFKDIETEEQDLELYNQFFTDAEMEYDYPSFIYAGEESRWSEGDPIKIDDMIEILQKIKAGNATHVEMSHNTDHHSYTLSPCEIRLATKEEIEAEKIRLDNTLKSQKEDRIKKMKNEIEKLENEIQ